MTVAFENVADPLTPSGDDSVRPFVVEALDVRGRAIQMGPALDAILMRHDYPAPVSRLLAEAIVLAVLLGSSLKIDGRFTLQTETNGAVDMLVVDYRSTGAIRAYARFDAERVAAAVASGEDAAGLLLGRGTLAMTIDQGTPVAIRGSCRWKAKASRRWRRRISANRNRFRRMSGLRSRKCIRGTAGRFAIRGVRAG
jgi:hypothetical protein